MSAKKIYSVPSNIADNAIINAKNYESMYQESIDNPNKFWTQQAEKFIDWRQKWDDKNVMESDFNTGDIKWFAGAKLNVSYNCLDRHLATRGNQTALIWESDDPNVDKKITYKELHSQVCKFANSLKKRGVKKGDRVCIYMPMIVEASVAMLACTRIGAVHSVVFGGFSPEALKGRILDSDCQTIITADEGVRGGKAVPLKANVDKAVEGCPDVKNVIVVKRTGGNVNWNKKHDVWLHDLYNEVDDKCEPVWMDAEDPLFILYTSGSTGKPKGVLHTTGGYLLFAAMTHKYSFDYKDGEIYWCTADVGWVTGHTYIVYGPLANGAISMMFEGIPTYPDAGRFWQVVEKHKVNIFYTAPTALRALMAVGDDFVKKHDRSSLRILGTVGEPINPEAWQWYYNIVGDKKCPIVDTWWQTETGGHLITPLPGATDLKPGSASKPFFGIIPAIVDEHGNELKGECEGNLIIKQSWPGQMRTIYGDHQRFKETYFSTYPGNYFTGDGCKRDKDGYYWITGRVDDVLNVSGHRLGTAEIESSLVLHPAVAESAIVGFPHDIKGQGIYAYVTLMSDIEATDDLITELVNHVRTDIGPIAKIDILQWAPALPKTRSGKIMRRILRKIAENSLDSMGDISTLADPSVVDSLINNRKNR
ncbi:MAG: acetate--CoA ligase [Gammaproteobacteria bacterium]|nr:MAG: acetate--CoA ligase [Gammaproteobacteria bacterium]